METSKQSLEKKIESFYANLTNLESVRLSQLRSSDEKGNLLLGHASCEEAAKRAGSIQELTYDEKIKVNDLLAEKLEAFEKSLNKEELTEFLVQISGSPMKHQSSFGVGERPTRCH